MNTNFHYLFKYIIVGDTSVGKSCLLLQFTQGKYNSNYEATLGVQFGCQTFLSKGKTVKAMIWDTAGQETFKSIIRSYYRGAIIALLVYDITNRPSFNNIPRWLDEIHSHSNQHIQIVIVGNKCDLEQSRQVQYKEGRQLADKLGFLFYEVSAKDNKFVNEAFERPAEQVIQKLENKEIVLSPGLNIGIKVGNPDAQPGSESRQSTGSISKKKKKKAPEEEGCSC